MRLSSSTLQQPVPPYPRGRRAKVVETLAEAVVARGSSRLAVVVDGRTGAGKTTFAHELGLALERAGRPVYRAGLDDFKRPWSERDRYDRASGEGFFHNAYDHGRIARDLAGPVRTHGLVTLCGIDPITQLDHGDRVTQMAPDGILVVDGVFALRAELVGLWDLRILLHVDRNVALRRGVARDTVRGDAVPHDEDVEVLHESRYAAADDLYLRGTDVLAAADMVIDNTDLAVPVILDSNPLRTQHRGVQSAERDRPARFPRLSSNCAGRGGTMGEKCS